MAEEAREEMLESAEAGPSPEVGFDPEALQRALAEQTQKAEGYLANWQRAQADLSNYKKRADQEKQETITFANAMVMGSLLPVMDDLERALDNVDAKLAGLTWVDGIKLIYRKLQSTLESQGLAMISTVGETFDPNVHEAVMEADGEQGKVVGELQKGYRFRDRVIRPAMVQVGSGKAEGSSQPEGGALE